MEQLESIRRDFVLRRDEIAAIVRDERGAFRIETDAEITPEEPSRTMLWSVLFASFFFVPVPDMPMGSDVAAVLRRVDRAALDEEFVRRVREMVRPGTSALFVLASQMSPDEIATALEEYGGTVLQWDVPPEVERMLLEALGDGGRPEVLAADGRD